MSSSRATPFKLTDLGNSERLVERYGASLRYAPALGWLGWDGCRWQRDDGSAERLAKLTARSIWEEVAAAEPEQRTPLIRHAVQSEGAQRISAMLQLARSDRAIEVDPSTLDANAWSFNLCNGTLDLRQRVLLAHDPADRITRLAPIDYEPTAGCPRWEQFLDRVTGGDVELQRFLQKAVGYALTAVSYEHILFILWGAGRNGKSTFLETLRYVFGDYALNVGAETLAKSKRSAGGPSEDMARMAGVRFVTAAETEEGVHLAESLVKRLTGGDRVTARLPYARSSFEFDPYGKIFLSTNHKPVIRGTDEGIWARVRLIPFTVRIPESEKDTKLQEKLRCEASGILNWGLEGLALYLKEGHLNAPRAVANATAAYRSEMDTLRRFVAAQCVEGREQEVKSSQLYAAYT
jgi:putative DNA primase/helicase